MDFSRRAKRLIMLVFDALMVPLAVWLSLSLRIGALYANFTLAHWVIIGITLLATIVAFVRLGLYRAVIRFMGQHAALAMLKGIAVSVLIFTLTVLVAYTYGWVTRYQVPMSTPVIYGFVAFVLLGAPRWYIRLYYQLTVRKSKKLALIYGAGRSGVELATALYNGNQYLPIAFVDDNRNLQGHQVNGIRVYSLRDLPELLQRYDIATVLLAMPSCTPARRRRILEELEPYSVQVKSVPSLNDILSDSRWAEHLQDLNIEDLLGREPVEPDPALIRTCIEDKVVMVTGAGGSIGSELCRQIIRFRPRQLVLFDVSEFALYQIEKELSGLIAQQKLPIQLTAFLGSVQDRRRLQMVMETYRVQTLYHAAAYKHVPMVELNMVEGVRNNIMGTCFAAEAAINAGVDNFMLVSTDKAVRPTNIMGATKRFAEMVLQGLAGTGSHTRFAMVRFGNVLGSSGSVVPLFREQICNGGPVTVTHPDVTRYFMTISEAAELVLQATAMAKGGDVFVLDMGEPVRIADLAHKMIHLMGYKIRDEEHPDGIEVVYSGLRAGEKLHEELLIGTEISGTRHPRILRAEEFYLPWNDVAGLLKQLQKACEENDCEAIHRILKSSGSEYVPTEDLQDLLWCDLNPPETAASNVISLEVGKS